jgi:rhamnopyranosyl-N-acetylglucosaminyl-diphospho-decaprenol beta-1,3/1,4-galactofuranosyltransferase
MPDVSERDRVVAVVVAYNRRGLLLETMSALAAQSHPLGALVVVDNASSDGSGDAVRERMPDADLLTLPRNTGGAGGFAVGVARALQHTPGWIWLMDDDTVPTPTALEELLRATTMAPGVTVAGSRAVWTDGRDHPMNTPREKPLVGRAERAAAKQAGSIAIRSTSFVSMLVSADAVRRYGLPVADYFIWNDDFEYSTRLLRHSRGLHVPASVVVHKTKQFGSTDQDPGERFFYEVRNKVWMMLFSSGLAPWEKVLYSGSTLRRWARTVLRSHQRSVLRAQLRRGLAAGFGHRPASNAVSLAGLGDATDAGQQAEATVRSGRGQGARRG